MRNKIIALVAVLGIIILAGCSKQADSKPTSNSTTTSTSSTVAETSRATSTESEATAETSGATSADSKATFETGGATSETGGATSETGGSTMANSEATAEPQGTTSSEVGEDTTESNSNESFHIQTDPSENPIMEFGDITVEFDIEGFYCLYNESDELVALFPLTVKNLSDKPNGLAEDSVTLLYNDEPMVLSVPLFGESEDIYQAVEPNEVHESTVYAFFKGKGVYTVKVSHADSTLTYSFTVD